MITVCIIQKHCELTSDIDKVGRYQRKTSEANMASSMQSLLAIVLLTLYVLTFAFPIFVSSQDIGNGFCDAANLDCTDHGQTVELKITVNKGSHFTGVPVDGSDDDNMKDCTDVYNSGQRQSGVYSIRPTQLSKPIQVRQCLNTECIEKEKIETVKYVHKVK